jgi:hypothetical protein
MPRVAVFRPHGGIEFQHFTVKQGAGQIDYFLKIW